MGFDSRDKRKRFKFFRRISYASRHSNYLFFILWYKISVCSTKTNSNFERDSHFALISDIVNELMFRGINLLLWALYEAIRMLPVWISTHLFLELQLSFEDCVGLLKRSLFEDGAVLELIHASILSINNERNPNSTYARQIEMQFIWLISRSRKSLF